MTAKLPLVAANILGLAAYCCTILASKWAPVTTTMLAGMFSLAMISASMWLLWTGTGDRSTPQDVPTGVP